MKTERIVLSFIAVLIGILVAAGGFYFYQTTKLVSVPQTKNNTSVTPLPNNIKPTPLPSISLSVDSPQDEEVVDNKSVTVSGKTTPGAVLIVSTNSNDDTITPASNGNFSTTVTINDGPNQIEITAVAPNGESTKVIRTVTFSTENF